MSTRRSKRRQSASAQPQQKKGPATKVTDTTDQETTLFSYLDEPELREISRLAVNQPQGTQCIER
jgi:hypothetical protein